MKFLRILPLLFLAASPALAQRPTVFPPPDTKPPPAANAPPNTNASGEETDLPPDAGPAMKKTQGRSPPPPSNLTIIYKLKYGGKLTWTRPDGTREDFDQWQSYKDDAHNLVTEVTRALHDGTDYKYAIEPLASKGFDPVDIPILYMTGDNDFEFTKTEATNLRKYLLDGGTIIFNAARGRDEFSSAVAREMMNVFPEKKFMRLPPDHPVFNSKYKLTTLLTQTSGIKSAQAPEIYSLDIGTRAAAIMVPMGLGASWTHSAYHPQGKHILDENLRLGVNIVAYVLGSTSYSRFLAQKFPVYAGRTREGDRLRHAVVKYAGSWDVNPGLQNSMMFGLHDNTGIGVDLAPKAVALDEPGLGDYPLVFMTGHYDFEFSGKEAKGLAEYLKKGGMLVASAAAGLKPFDTAFRREIKKALPDAELIKIPPTHPIFSGWDPAAKEAVAYTRAALHDNPELKDPEFYGLFVDDRLAVLYTPYDLNNGLNGETNAYAKGVESPDALRLAVNIVAYSMSH